MMFQKATVILVLLLVVVLGQQEVLTEGGERSKRSVEDYCASGTFYCDIYPTNKIPPIRYELWEHEPLFISDKKLTDDLALPSGLFSVKTQYSDVFDFDPFMRVYHRCNPEARCQIVDIKLRPHCKHFGEIRLTTLTGTKNAEETFCS